jgi:hypothetical protein
MRFKTGFFLGCAAGAWAASKASQLKEGVNAQVDWPRVASSRAEHLSAEISAERVRAFGDLARERLNGFLGSPLGELARDRLVDIVGASRVAGNGRDAAPQHRKPG